MNTPEVIECSWPVDCFIDDPTDALCRPLVYTPVLGLYYTIRRGVPVAPDPRLVRWVQRV